ncbi:MAG: hypothetical protein J2P21_25950 [Chloracidobacterium sp.]|nr:hypothetical protein [Chloracidobacterium sp.]
MDVGVPPSPIKSITENKPIFMHPEDLLRVILPDKHLTAISKTLSKHGYNFPDLTQVIFRIEEIIYEDGMMWDAGHWYKPNPNEPGKYVRIDNK